MPSYWNDCLNSGNDCLDDEKADREDVGVLLDDLVHERLREHGLVDFVVPCGIRSGEFRTTNTGRRLSLNEFVVKFVQQMQGQFRRTNPGC